MRTASILLVCTGNLCRSPAAELLLADRLGPAAHDYSIHSAGTKAVTGSPIDPTMRELLGRRGIEATGSLACQVTVGMLESADLILTASTSHRAAVVRILPRAVRKTLTLKQLARYAPAILRFGGGTRTGAERVEWILAAVPQARALVPMGDDSIADPLGKSRRHYRVAIDQLDDACAVIASVLGDPATASTSPGIPGSPDGWWSDMSTVEFQDRADRP